MLRLFVALPVPLDVARRLADLVPSELGGLKRVAPDMMHVTLAFIGWLDEKRVGYVTAAVELAAAGGGAFDVPLRAVGRFPPSGRPRVIWVGTAAEPQILALGELVRDALAEAGVPFDRKPLRPHVTLARARESIALEEARALGSAVPRARVPEGLRFRAEAVHVMQSVLSPKGPRYSSLAQVPLGRGDGSVR